MSVRIFTGRLCSSRQNWLTVMAFVLVGLLPLVFAASGSANPKIKIAAPTSLKLSITRVADGTFTIEARYTSPNPHCLERERWGPDPRGGGFVDPPTFGLNYLNPTGIGYNFPKAPGIPVPELKPITPFEHSPLVWKVVWPGSTIVSVEGRGAGARNFESTVSAATGLNGFAWAPIGKKEFAENDRGDYYAAIFGGKGHKTWLKCWATKKLEVKESDTFPLTLSASSSASTKF